MLRRGIFGDIFYLDKYRAEKIELCLGNARMCGSKRGHPFISTSDLAIPEFVLLNLITRIIYNLLPKLIFKRFIILSGSMRIILRILAVVMLIMSTAWFYSDQNFQSGLAVVGSVSTLVSTFLFRQKGSNGKEQTQTVGDRSSAIQAGGDANISIESRNSKDD